MALSKNKKEKIAQLVIEVLYRNFAFERGDSFSHIPFSILFNGVFNVTPDGRVKDIPDFINLSSWMHGLNTTLGQTFFESVAHTLCTGDKQTFPGRKIYKNQMTAIADIMIDLKNGTQAPSVQREDDIIAANAYGELQDAPNFTADCFYKTDTEVVAIELKSVRPNSGEMRGEKQKILVGKAVLRAIYPDKNVKYIFGFPFDPTSDGNTTYDKERFLHYLVEAEKFVAHDDFLIADELWSFLASSNGAMQEMLDIINHIATPSFMDIFNKIQDERVNKDEKRALLEQWYQYTEVEIIDKVQRNASNCRLYNQPIFKIDGSYNGKRSDLLK